MRENQIKKTYNGIDLIKFICAFLVCAIHITPIQGLDSKYLGYINYALQNGICRIAVPFFFCASGFLLFNKIDINCIDRNRLKTYCFKNCRLFGLWITLLFLGSTAQLWYLGGVVIATIITWILLKNARSLRKVLVIGFCLYSIGLVFDSYSGFIISFAEKHNIDIVVDFLKFVNNDVSRTASLGLFSSVIFFAFGILFSQVSIKINIKISFILFLISLSFVIIEALAIKHFSKPLDHNMYISLIPATFFLFNIAKNLTLKESPIYKRMRVIGVLIFFLHLFVFAVLDLILNVILANTGVNLIFLEFFLTIIITTVISAIIERLSNRKKFRWLKYLYS